MLCSRWLWVVERLFFGWKRPEFLRDGQCTVVYPFFFFFQAEDGIRDDLVTGVQTCALPILPEHLLRTLSGGQRRRIELARILFGRAQTLLLDEPTNHLDADSMSWLRDHLRAFRGGLVVISHDTALLDSVVNKVFHLDADRCVLDVYNLGWNSYLDQRETDARRRRRERSNAQRQATALQSQADKIRAKATKARAAQSMQRRAERLLAGVSADP